MSNRYKRRNFFIKKDFQGKLILGYFLFVMGGCLFFIFLFALLSADSLTISYSGHDIHMGQTPVMLFKNAIKAHWLFIVFGGLALSIASLFITHRIAGPLFRFEKAFDNMIAGNLNDKIYLRNKDEGKDMANKINTFNSGLSNQLRQIEKHSRIISDLLQQNEFLSSKEADPEEIAHTFDIINKNTLKIREISASFTLSDD